MILRLLFIFQTFLAFETSTEVLGANHRCYVCIPNVGSSISDVIQMFPEGTDIPPCNLFQTEKTNYIMECPSSNYQGCLTQTNGTHVTKTCAEVGIEDCKTANKITYCYCKDELCNKEPVPAEVSLPPELPADDDEDSPSEGSGSPEGSSSKMETSSEIDLGLELTHRYLPPTTIKSVVLTTPSPEGGSTAKASACRVARPINIFCLLSFLLLCKV